MADSNQSVEVEYKAPVATYRYVTDKMPTQLRYERKLLTPNVSWEVVSTKGGNKGKFHEVKEITRIGGSIQYQKTLPGKFNYARDIFTSIFDFEEVGDYWEVIEQYEGRLVMPNRNDLPRFLTPEHYSGTTAQ